MVLVFQICQKWLTLSPAESSSTKLWFAEPMRNQPHYHFRDVFAFFTHSKNQTVSLNRLKQEGHWLKLSSSIHHSKPIIRGITWISDHVFTFVILVHVSGQSNFVHKSLSSYTNMCIFAVVSTCAKAKYANGPSMNRISFSLDIQSTRHQNFMVSVHGLE